MERKSIYINLLCNNINMFQLDPDCECYISFSKGIIMTMSVLTVRICVDLNL